MEEKKWGGNERRGGDGFMGSVAAGTGDIGVDDVDDVRVRVRVRVRSCVLVVVVD